jgi:hypothetical protein
VSLGSHQKAKGKSQVYITPREILDPLGPFDFDACAATVRPWDCARINIVEAENGLARDWSDLGRGWLNPPFFGVAPWVQKFADHNRGIALLHARTETDWFAAVWKSASGILFLASRIFFYRPDGSRHDHNSGAPPVLVSFGIDDREVLRNCGIPGFFVSRWEIRT